MYLFPLPQHLRPKTGTSMALRTQVTLKLEQAEGSSGGQKEDPRERDGKGDVQGGG